MCYNSIKCINSGVLKLDTVNNFSVQRNERSLIMYKLM